MEAIFKKEEREPVVIDVEGVRMLGVFHHPLNVKSAPYVLFCHGLAGHKIGKHRIYVKIATQLAEFGIGSLRVDFRGSGDSEGHFSDVTLKSLVKDAKTALEFLLNFPKAQQIGIYGRSLGAVIALFAAADTPLIKSLCLWSPVFRGDQWHHLLDALDSPNLNPQKKEELLRFNTQLCSMALYREMFATDLVPLLKKLQERDLMIITPESDDVLDSSHTQGYLECRKRAAGRTEHVKLVLSDHDFSIPKERNLAILKTVEWFVETL